MDHDFLGGFRERAQIQYLWLCESKEIVPKAYEIVANHFSSVGSVYRKIFTHDYSLLALSDKFVYVPPAANYTWIRDFSRTEKTRIATMISSGKDWTVGHKKRNKMLREVQSKFPWIECYGRAFRPFSRKEDVLKDTLFSITVENSKYECYYTEKVMDCFASRTIPIYFGCNSISSWFDPAGIIRFDTDSLHDVINMLSVELYDSLRESIEANFQLCLKHKRADDCLYDAIVADLGSDEALNLG